MTCEPRLYSVECVGVVAVLVRDVALASGRVEGGVDVLAALSLSPRQTLSMDTYCTLHCILEL